MQEVFSAYYEVEPLLYAGTTDPLLNFGSPDQGSGSPLSLVVRPSRGASWAGDFFGYHDGLRNWFSTPDPHRIMVVVGGVVHWVDVDQPHRHVTWNDFYVASVHAAPMHGLLLLVGTTGVRAVDGSRNIHWDEKDIVSDGFDEVRISGDVVSVRGFNAPQGVDIEVTLKMNDGQRIT